MNKNFRIFLTMVAMATACASITLGMKGLYNLDNHSQFFGIIQGTCSFALIIATWTITHFALSGLSRNQVAKVISSAFWNATAILTTVFALGCFGSLSAYPTSSLRFVYLAGGVFASAVSLAAFWRMLKK